MLEITNPVRLCNIKATYRAVVADRQQPVRWRRPGSHRPRTICAATDVCQASGHTGSLATNIGVAMQQTAGPMLSAASLRAPSYLGRWHTDGRQHTESRPEARSAQTSIHWQDDDRPKAVSLTACGVTDWWFDCLREATYVHWVSLSASVCFKGFLCQFV